MSCTTGCCTRKIATIDGVWTAIGSSNLDRRSFIYNNEVDAIVLGRETARAVEAMLRDWMSHAEPISLKGWQSRSLHEHAGRAADAALEPLHVALESTKNRSIQQIPAAVARLTIVTNASCNTRDHLPTIMEVTFSNGTLGGAP